MTRCISRVPDRFSEFVLPLGPWRRENALSVLESAAGAVRNEGYSSLAATSLDSTALAAWWRQSSQGMATETQSRRFGVLCRYFHWLYERDLVGAYALRWIRSSEAVGQGWVSLRLTRPLQRLIDAHVARLDWYTHEQRTKFQRVLGDFERFLNVRAAPVSRSTVVEWVRDRVSRYRDREERHSVGILRRFLDAHPELWAHGNPGDSPANLPAGALVRALRAGEPIPKTRSASAVRTELTPHWQRFVCLKRRMGRRYKNEEARYRELDKSLASRGHRRLADLTPACIDEFVCARTARRRSVFRDVRGILRVLFRHLVARGILPVDPTARLRQRGEAAPPPYVYTHKEIRALLEAARSIRGQPERGWPVYTMFHLLYGCGLRVGEMQRLELQDVNLDNRCLHIRQTKFFKDRLVPFNERVAENLKRYLDWRLHRYPPRSPQQPLFLSREHRSFTYSRMNHIFAGLRRAAGIQPAIPGQRAGIHGLRRAFACHRLLRWYREGVDVNAKLPLLATYMGHRDWEYTRVYLTMTPVLMKTAARRFLPTFQETLGEAP